MHFTKCIHKEVGTRPTSFITFHPSEREIERACENLLEMRTLRFA